MNDPIHLDLIAYKRERVASRRLAVALGLSESEALRRTLEAKAGAAGLAALVEARTLEQREEAGRAAARAALREAAKAKQASRHEGAPTPWRAWFDGSATPNPGRCGIGALLCGPDGARIEVARAAGYGNSSEAEYLALIALLEAAVAHGVRGLTIYGDSQVVIGDALQAEALAAPSLQAYREQAGRLLARLPGTTLRWVPRHKNQEADALSRRAVGLHCATDPTTAIHAPRHD